jgi:hypothetical protein
LLSDNGVVELKPHRQLSGLMCAAVDHVQQPQQPPGTKLPGFVSAGIIQQGEEKQPEAEAATAGTAHGLCKHPQTPALACVPVANISLLVHKYIPSITHSAAAQADADVLSSNGQMRQHGQD